ncbi:Polyadenylate-binding protein 2 [Linum perenne]
MEEIAQVQRANIEGASSNNDPQLALASLFVEDLDFIVDETQLFDLFSNMSAAKALELLNFTRTNGRPIRVMYSNNGPNVHKSGVENIFIKNFDKGLDHKALFDTFSILEESCPASWPLTISDDYFKRIFDDAARAIDALNRMKVHAKEWYVGRARKKNEREFELRQEAIEKFQDSNLYVKNIDDSLGEDELKQFFPPFGIVRSCKVMQYPNGINKISGFVVFATPKEVNKVKKEDRRGRRHPQFYEMPPMPMYPPRGPASGQSIFYSQIPLAMNMIPPQTGFGYQQHQPGFGMMPGGQSMPNYFVPMMVPRSHGVLGGPVSGDDAPLDMVVGAHAARPRPVGSIGDLTNALENATLKQQLTMLGENLYPLVKQVEPDGVGKVLDMDQTEVLHLLESPNALKAKRADASTEKRRAGWRRLFGQESFDVGVWTKNGIGVWTKNDIGVWTKNGIGVGRKNGVCVWRKNGIVVRRKNGVGVGKVNGMADELPSI